MRTQALHALLASAALLAVLGVGATVVEADQGADVSIYQTDRWLDDADDVTAAIDDGTATPADELVAGETLVVSIDSGRLADDLDARDGDATERFFAVAEGNATFEIVQANPSPERARKAIAVGPANATALRAGSTTYLLVDTGSVDFERPPDGDPAELRDGDEYQVRFGYDDPVSGPRFELSRTAAEFYGLPGHQYAPLPPEWVNRSVSVHVEPDDRLFAQLTLEDGRTLEDDVGRVGWAGSPGVSLDLRDVEPGTGYTLELVHDGEVVERHEGTVREVAARLSDPTVEANATTTEWGTASFVNVTATLSHGGHVEVLTDDGELLGRSYRDVDGDPIQPDVETRVSVDFRVNGSDDVATDPTEEIQVRAARERHTSEAFYQGPNTTLWLDYDLEAVFDRDVETPSSEGTATADGPGSDTPGADSRSDDADGPLDQHGFGAVLAVVALALTVLSGRRR